MTLEEYCNLIENAFKIHNWNYARNDNGNKSLFIINFLENGECYAKCNVTVSDNGICDMNAFFPFKCPGDESLNKEVTLSCYIANFNYTKRYATLRYDYESGNIVSSYSFNIFPTMTPEFILSKFNTVRNMNKDNYNYIKKLCEQQDDKETQETQETETFISTDQKGKYKIDL